MDGKKEIVQALKNEKQRWEALLADMREAQITAPDLPDQWSIKDVMAHLMAWQLVTNARLGAALAHREPAYPDWFGMEDEEAEGQPHQTNAHIFGLYHGEPWDVVYRRWRDGFQKVIDSSEAVPEEDLFGAGKFPWMGPYRLVDVLHGTLGHHAEHFDTLQALLR